jgi:hypothetical protein
MMVKCTCGIMVYKEYINVHKSRKVHFDAIQNLYKESEKLDSVVEEVYQYQEQEFNFSQY